MFTDKNIAAFQQNLIDRENQAKREDIKKDILGILDEEKISRTKLRDMILTLHSLVNGTDCTMAQLIDAASELVPSDKHSADFKGEQLWEWLLYHPSFQPGD
jgi:hypothetical protein